MTSAGFVSEKLTGLYKVEVCGHLTQFLISVHIVRAIFELEAKVLNATFKHFDPLAFMI
jgi:hypothetical protein